MHCSAVFSSMAGGPQSSAPWARPIPGRLGHVHLATPFPMTVQELIRRYGLEPHPEGGWYREVHRSGELVGRQDGCRRSGLTAILFLLPQDDISRWHRVCGADESWHHAGGAPLELLCLPPEGGRLRRQHLASLAAPMDLPEESAMPLAIVPAGWWQAARSLGAWSLMSCCVGPGFDFADFSLLRDLPAARHPAGALVEFL